MGRGKTVLQPSSLLRVIHVSQGNGCSLAFENGINQTMGAYHTHDAPNLASPPGVSCPKCGRQGRTPWQTRVGDRQGNRGLGPTVQPAPSSALQNEDGSSWREVRHCYSGSYRQVVKKRLSRHPFQTHAMIVGVKVRLCARYQGLPSGSG